MKGQHFSKKKPNAFADCFFPMYLAFNFDTFVLFFFGMLTKLENLMTINEPFNLVIFALKVKFINIDLVTMNFHTHMTRLKRPHANFRACQFQIQAIITLHVSTKVFSSVHLLDL